jgi:anti-anti-sigma factor
VLRRRVHRVIAELDAHGEIDEHAALCMRFAIDDARPAVDEIVLVDLRDLTTIDAAGLALFRRHNAECYARGMDLALLIGGLGHHGQIAGAFVRAGLGEHLHYRDPEHDEGRS